MCSRPLRRTHAAPPRATVVTGYPEQLRAETKPRTIAVVDDDRGVRDSLQFLLEVSEHAVVTFASAAEFLEAKVRNLAGLIVDHHMPNMTGLQLVETLRADGVTTPVLLITGSPSPDLLVRASALGIHRVLEKLIIDDDLLDFINAAGNATEPGALDVCPCRL